MPDKRNPEVILSRSPGKGRWMVLLGGLAVSIALYATIEGAFRLLRYRELRSTRQLARTRVLDAPLLRFDRDMGFRYLPNTTVRQVSLDSGRVLGTNAIHLNNMGHVSNRPYSIDHAEGIFRVAAIGDSFTACTFSDSSWSDLLEDLLNADPALGEDLGIERFEVLNFGMDGTGFVQWPSVYEHDAAAYRPDLVLVAFIENDLWRSFKWMDTLVPYSGAAFQIMMVSESLPVGLENPAAVLAPQIVLRPADANHPGQRERFLQEALSLRLAAMPWLSPRPELIGTLLTQADWPTPSFLRPRLLYHLDRPPRRGKTQRMTRAVEGVRAIESTAAVLLVHLPLASELKSRRAPEDVLEFMALAQPTPAVSLIASLLERARTGDSSKWFIEGNQHPSNDGVRIYAAAIFEVLRTRLGSRARRAPSDRRDPK